MSRAASIDVFQEDRGLRTCFNAANLEQPWQDEFVKRHNIATLDDFVYMVTQSDWERSISEMVDSCPGLKSNRVVLSRFKAAWESGSNAVKQASQPISKGGADQLDELLPESTISSVSREFHTRYGLELDAALEPSDALRSRVYREFRKSTMTVIDARKIKSIIMQAAPKLQESVSLPGGLKLEFDRDLQADLHTAVSYYWALRVLAYAWAWSGNYRVRDFDGKERLFLNLADSLNYADHALRQCMEFGQGSVLWMQRNDVLTRGKMAGLIRRGYTGGSALAEALRQCHLEWRSPAMQPVPELKSTKRPPEPTGGPPQPGAPGPAKRARQLKTDQFVTISMIKGGKRICKKWNDPRGCSGCDDLHVCDVKLPSGKACQSKSHNRMGHPTE